MTGETAGLSYVARLRQQIAQERMQITGQESRIQVLESRLREYNADLRTIPAQTTELARHERERTYAERMYEGVVGQLQRARIAEESEPGYAHIIRMATRPLLPSRPDVVRSLAMGIFLGLVLGFGLGIVRDKLDNRIYKPDQLKAKGYHLIGTVPNLKQLIKSEHKGKEFVEADGQKYSTSLVSLLNPISPITESYRNVRTHIQFSRPEAVVQTILVTSASVSEGKSTTSANLAIVMAEAGRRTLLIDADLRRPREHSLFGIDISPGLVQFLCNEPEFDADIVKTNIDNLFIVPAGRVVSKSSELLATRRLRDFLKEMRDQFDVIIIDTPPVRVATDAALLSTQCDATLLVVRAGQTKEGELDLALQSLASVGARVTGLLFNGFDVSMAYGYKYRYKDYGRYSQYSKYGYYGYTDSEESHTS